MAVIATQAMPLAGAALTYAAVNAADRFYPGDRTFLHVKNGNASPTNVTLTVTGRVSDLTPASRVVAVPASGDRLIPLPAALYQSADGLGDVAYSVTATVTAAVVYV